MFFSQPVGWLVVVNSDALVLPCAGVEPVKGEWSAEELAWFESLVLENSFFVVEVGRKEGVAVVALLDTSKSETVDVTEAMKAAFSCLPTED